MFLTRSSSRDPIAKVLIVWDITHGIPTAHSRVFIWMHDSWNGLV